MSQVTMFYGIPQNMICLCSHYGRTIRWQGSAFKTRSNLPCCYAKSLAYLCKLLCGTFLLLFYFIFFCRKNFAVKFCKGLQRSKAHLGSLCDSVAEIYILCLFY